MAGAARLRIVLVDDHPGVRATTAALLTDLGHDVTEAADGPEALALVRAEPAGFDLLISDYAMPGMSGIDLIREVRAVNAGLPALIITGYAEVELLGARPADVHLLLKPFDVDTLTTLIGDAVRMPAGLASPSPTFA